LPLVSSLTAIFAITGKAPSSSRIASSFHGRRRHCRRSSSRNAWPSCAGLPTRQREGRPCPGLSEDFWDPDETDGAPGAVRTTNIAGILLF